MNATKDKPEIRAASRYARLLVATLKETDDLEEALLAADYAMAFDASFAFVESEHPRDEWGRFVDTVHAHIKKNQGITTDEIAHDLKVEAEHVSKATTELIEQGRINRIDLSPNRKPEHAEFVKNVLSKIPKGLPGLESKPKEMLIGKHIPVDGHEIVYRGPDGSPVAVAILISNGEGGFNVKDFATDKSKGLLGARAAIEVGKVLQKMGAIQPTGTMSPDAARLQRKANRPNASMSWFAIDETNTFFSHDIFNPHAQRILDKAMKAAKKLSAEARKAFVAALKLTDTAEMVQSIIRFIEKYRAQLAKLLTTTQIAAVLEGAREVAKGLPTVPPAWFGAPFPTSIPPERANALVERIKAMPEAEQWREIYDLPADQQSFMFTQMRITGNMPPPIQPSVEGEPEGVHFPIIDEAVKELANKNVIDRQSYDRLDAAARQKSFTVARVTSDETLTKIRDALAENVKEGADFRTFKEAMLEEVESGTFMSDGHLELVFRANIHSAYSNGQMTVLNLPFVQSGFPYAGIYSIHDDRVRPEHKEVETLGLNGTNIFRITDPVFQLFRGPWSYGCRCGWNPMTVRMAAEAGVEEAAKWIRDGFEPRPPAYVRMPDFSPPPGFRRDIAVQLSMQPLCLEN